MTAKSRLFERLVNGFQRGFPLVAAPFDVIAAACGVDESQVLSAFGELKERGIISRIGPVFAPRRMGASTLAAMAVPAERLDAVADWVSSLPEVNHNYERENELNLWFVLTAVNEERLVAVLNEIHLHTGLEVHDLRLEEEYRIDLGFPIPQGVLEQALEAADGGA